MMTNDSSLTRYYGRRAAEYERIYARPERQRDLEWLEGRLRELLAGRRILEIACGTGYWTAVVAPVASFILATDGAPETLELARARAWPPGRVTFGLADAYRLDTVRDFGPFTAAFAGFWWSHVPRGDLRAFLLTVRRAVEPGARVVFIDNLYVPGSSTPISRVDADGNTYQIRRLDDGSEHEVLKNFPDENELEAALDGIGRDVRIERSEYFWCLSATT